MKKFLIAYHANCADGLIAAATMCLVNNARHHTEGCEVYTKATNYGAKDISELNQHIANNRDNYDVIQFVDFFPDILTIECLRTASLQVEIYDHHVNSFKTSPDLWEGIDVMFDLCYDNTRSGAGIVADLMPLKEATDRIVDLVSDRDTWQFELGMASKYLHEVITAHFVNKNASPWDVAHWISRLTLEDVSRAVEEGKVRYDVTRSAITKHIESYKPNYIQIKGEQVPAYNMGLAWASEASDILAERTAQGGVWIFYQITGPVVNISIRSRDASGLRALDVAKHFNGGGHVDAAGANGVDISLFLDLFV